MFLLLRINTAFLVRGKKKLYVWFLMMNLTNPTSLCYKKQTVNHKQEYLRFEKATNTALWSWLCSQTTIVQFQIALRCWNLEQISMGQGISDGRFDGTIWWSWMGQIFVCFMAEKMKYMDPWTIFLRPDGRKDVGGSLLVLVHDALCSGRAMFLVKINLQGKIRAMMPTKIGNINH